MKELKPLRGENKFQATPQNRILLPLRGSFQNDQRAAPSFLGGVPPTGLKFSSAFQKMILIFKYYKRREEVEFEGEVKR